MKGAHSVPSTQQEFSKFKFPSCSPILMYSLKMGEDRDGDEGTRKALDMPHNPNHSSL